MTLIGNSLLMRRKRDVKARKKVQHCSKKMLKSRGRLFGFFSDKPRATM